MLAENKFGTGANIGREDLRDFEYKAGAAPFDWVKGFDIEAKLGFNLPVKDQNGSGSCGGQAFSYYGEVLEALATGTFEERSAKFIYSQSFTPPWGSSGRDNCKVVTKQGWAKESVLPSYENGQPPSEAFMQRSGDITQSVRDDAQKAKSLSYYAVDTDIETIAHAIESGKGIVLGITGENNGTWLSAFPKVAENESWRHWVYAGKAKIINGKKYIGFINSWGNIGEQGWQWIGEEWFNGRWVWNAWTLIYDAQIKQVFNLDMRFGDQNEEVKFLQVRLQDLNFFPKNQTCTGFYGNITKDAVRNYAMSNMLSVTGKIVGPTIRGFLNK